MPKRISPIEVLARFWVGVVAFIVALIPFGLPAVLGGAISLGFGLEVGPITLAARNASAANLYAARRRCRFIACPEFFDPAEAKFSIPKKHARREAKTATSNHTPVALAVVGTAPVATNNPGVHAGVAQS